MTDDKWTIIASLYVPPCVSAREGWTADEAIREAYGAAAMLRSPEAAAVARACTLLSRADGGAL
jgi:hypothetical protein